MTFILRSKSARFNTGLFALAALLTLIGSFINGGFIEATWAIPISFLIAAVGWVIFFNPRLEIRPDGVVVANIFREFTIAWPDLERAESRWGLYLYTRLGRKISVWALPSSAGLFNNSWLKTKMRTVEPELDFSGSGRESHYVTAEFAADAINIRLSQLAADAKLRKATARESLPTKTAVQQLPVVALVVPLLVTILVWSN